MALSSSDRFPSPPGPVPPTSLQARVDLAQQGCEKSLDELLRLARPRLTRYAERYCEVHDVEDAVQETMLAMSRHLSQLRAGGALWAWLFRIVKRECDRLKRWLRLHVLDWDPARPLPEPILQSLPELRRDLSMAFAGLPPMYREVLLLREVSQMPLRELSTRLDLTLAATKSRLHRARLLVREALGPL